jgi:quercetin dioxygenase-like cupin family protein
VGHRMQLVRLADLEREVPAGHWGVASQIVERAGDRLTVQVCEMAPDGGAEPHTHEAHDQMFLVLDGALRRRPGQLRRPDLSGGAVMRRDTPRAVAPGE